MAAPFLALDVGGTKLATGIISADGEILAERTASTRSDSTPSEVSDALFELADQALLDAGLGLSDLAAAGVSFGGPVDHPAGKVITCHHLASWEGTPLRDLVAGRTGLPTVMDNDANAAALAETVFGAARGCQHVLYVTVSTGIGAGLVLDGRIYRGFHSMAGELGHTHLVPYGPKCTCGRLGCLESVASGWAIAKAARDALACGAASALRAIPCSEIAAHHVAEMAQADPLAARIISQAGEYLGLGLARAVNLINPQAVVIGGGVSQAGEVLMSPVRRSFMRHVMPELAQGLRLVCGALAPRWGLFGAAALALREVPGVGRQADGACCRAPCRGAWQGSPQPAAQDRSGATEVCEMAKVLVVYHSLSGNTRKMAEAVAEGARGVAGTEVAVKTGLEAGIDDLLSCDAVALGSPDYFGYIAGGLKDFLDRTYYPSQDKVAGKPAAVFASAGGPPEKVIGVLEQALGWFKLKAVAKPVGTSGVSAGALSACRELGRSLAEAAGRR